MKYLFLIAFYAALMTGCGDDVLVDSRQSYRLYSNLPDTIEADKDFIMTLYYIKPNPCYKFEKLEMVQDGNEFDLSVWIKVDNPETFCPQELIADSLNKSINLPKGKYIFRYLAYNGSSIDELVVK